MTEFVPIERHNRFRPAGETRIAQIRPMDLGALEGKPIPERQWLVPDWIPAGNVTMLNGDGGVGKSLLAMQLLTAAATGGSWLGMPVQRNKALGIFCEDTTDELHRRQSAINSHHGHAFTDLEDLHLVSRVGFDNSLMTFNQYEKTSEESGLWVEIVNLIQEVGAGLVVLDSLHDLFAGNENSRPEARRFIQLLAEACRDHGATVVLSAHPSAAGLQSGSGYSGSTAWNNAVRSRVYLKRPKNDGDGEELSDRRVLERMKSNYSGIGDKINLLWRDGVLIPDVPEGGIIGTINKDNADRVFLALLDATTAAGRSVSDSAHSQNFAPKLFAKSPDRQGFGKSDFERAMERLFADGKIRMVEYGRVGDMRKRIERTAGNQ